MSRVAQRGAQHVLGELGSTHLALLALVSLARAAAAALFARRSVVPWFPAVAAEPHLQACIRTLGWVLRGLRNPKRRRRRWTATHLAVVLAVALLAASVAGLRLSCSTAFEGGVSTVVALRHAIDCGWLLDVERACEGCLTHTLVRCQCSTRAPQLRTISGLLTCGGDGWTAKGEVSPPKPSSFPDFDGLNGPSGSSTVDRQQPIYELHLHFRSTLDQSGVIMDSKCKIRQNNVWMPCPVLMGISSTSLGSSQILRLPHFSTE